MGFSLRVSRDKPIKRRQRRRGPHKRRWGLFIALATRRAEYVRQGCHGQTGSYPWINTEENHPHHDRPAHHSTYTERAKGDTSEAHCNEPSNTLSSRSDQYIRTEAEDHQSICSKILYPYNKYVATETPSFQLSYPSKAIF